MKNPKKLVIISTVLLIIMTLFLCLFFIIPFIDILIDGDWTGEIVIVLGIYLILPLFIGSFIFFVISILKYREFKKAYKQMEQLLKEQKDS